MEDNLRLFLLELKRQTSQADNYRIYETNDDALSTGLVGIHRENSDYFDGLLALKKQIYDHLEAQTNWAELALPSDVPAWKLLAYSRPMAAFLKPSYILKRFEDLQAVLRRQGTALSTCNIIHTQDIWEHRDVENWISSDRSSILFLESTESALCFNPRLDQFVLEIIGHLSKHHSVANILDIPRSTESGPLKAPTPEAVLEQVTMQVLHFTTQNMPLKYVVECLHAFKTFKNAKDWMTLLFRTCKAVQCMMLVVDLRILRPYAEEIQSWPSVFARNIEEVPSTSRNWLKVLFIKDEFQSFRYPEKTSVVSVGNFEETTHWALSFPALHVPQPDISQSCPPPIFESSVGEINSSYHLYPHSQHPEAPLDSMADPEPVKVSRDIKLPPQTPDDIRIAIICPLTLEANALEAVFDQHWDEVDKTKMKAPGDKNSYSFGVLSGYQVVLAYMPNMGKASSAMVASHCRSSFRKILLAMVVGICGGVPFYRHTDECTQEIVLGDVVISEGIVAYDFGRQYPEGLVRKKGTQNTPGRLAPELRSLLNQLKGFRHRKRLIQRTSSHLVSLVENHVNLVHYPGAERDRLFEGTYRHKHRQPDSCTICLDKDESGICPWACSLTCEELCCDEDRTILRKKLESIVPCTDPVLSPPVAFFPTIHFGLIASGDQVMKSGEHRDRMAKSEGVIAFEMEAAGVWDIFPCCVVIKGVCDYADSHKNKEWQTYAAATAAACTKGLLQEWCVVD